MPVALFSSVASSVAPACGPGSKSSTPRLSSVPDCPLGTAKVPDSRATVPLVSFTSVVAMKADCCPVGATLIVPELVMDP